jgi:hypothetical protein
VGTQSPFSTAHKQSASVRKFNFANSKDGRLCNISPALTDLTQLIFSFPAWRIARTQRAANASHLREPKTRQRKRRLKMDVSHSAFSMTKVLEAACLRDRRKISWLEY